MNRPATVDATGLEIRDDLVAGRHGDVPIRRYRGEPGAATLVWMHGGAFSHGGLDQLESHAVAIAIARAGLDVVAVDYRRVPAWSWLRDAPDGQLPGIRYPVPLDDVAAVFETVAGERDVTFLGGASAGACLSAAAALRSARTGRRVPAGLALAYGTFHAQLPPIGPDLRRRIRGRHGLMQFRPTTVRRMNHNYAGSLAAMEDAFAFPGGHDVRGMPPTLMLDADRDSLRASGEAFAADLVAAGVPVASHLVDGSIHGFLDRPSTPAFDAGIDVMRAWLASETERNTSR